MPADLALLKDFIIDLFNLLPSRNRVSAILFLLYRRMFVRIEYLASIAGLEESEVEKLIAALQVLGVDVYEEEGNRFAVLKPSSPGWWLIHMLLDIADYYASILEEHNDSKIIKLAVRLRTEPYIFLLYAAYVIVGSLCEQLVGFSQGKGVKRAFEEWLTTAVSEDQNKRYTLDDFAMILGLDAKYDKEIIEVIVDAMTQLGVAVYLKELGYFLIDHDVVDAVKLAREKAGLNPVSHESLLVWLKSEPIQQPSQ